MKLVLKTMQRAGGRSMYLYFPEGAPRTAFKRCAVTILRDEDSEASVKALLNEGGLAKLSEEKQIVFAFPNPVDGGWNYALDADKADDLGFLTHIQGEMNNEEESPSRGPASTPDQMRAMMSTMMARVNKSWHLMNDTKYIAGFGSGASMACTLAALQPTFAAAVFADGGKMAPNIVKQATWAAMPAYLVNCPETTVSYFMKVNGAMLESDTNGVRCFRSGVNPNQFLFTAAKATLPAVYDALFCHVRRPNTGKYGDIERRMVPETDYRFDIFLDDDRLSDGVAHTWFAHVPEAVKANPDKKVPLLVFFHGASDNPAEAAEMSKFHELGDREGFISAFPWSTNKSNWNSDMLPDGKDDDAFSIALIDYMIANYPVDASRVYLSGFSNGAAQAQTVAFCHPDRIAASCPIDSNWPGNREGESEVDWHDVPAMRIGMEKKKDYDYRIPCWYTYGSREPSYPVFNNCTQQHQYDYWKLYNNITIKPTPGINEPHPCGCGVPGDTYERIAPSKTHPHHTYDAQRFNSNDPGSPNLYNYVVMLDKGHDIAEMDPALGWKFVSQFRRNPDGSLEFLSK